MSSGQIQDGAASPKQDERLEQFAEEQRKWDTQQRQIRFADVNCGDDDERAHALRNGWQVERLIRIQNRLEYPPNCGDAYEAGEPGDDADFCDE